MTGSVKKVVLAYSGGLDTSVILRWLQDTYRCEVVTFTADLGQGEDLEPARQKAKLLGIKEVFVDLQGADLALTEGVRPSRKHLNDANESLPID